MREIEATRMDSLLGHVGYLLRLKRPKLKANEKIVIIGGKRYIRRSADEVSWL